MVKLRYHTWLILSLFLLCLQSLFLWNEKDWRQWIEEGIFGLYGNNSASNRGKQSSFNANKTWFRLTHYYCEENERFEFHMSLFNRGATHLIQFWRFIIIDFIHSNCFSLPFIKSSVFCSARTCFRNKNFYRTHNRLQFGRYRSLLCKNLCHGSSKMTIINGCPV